MSEPDKPPHDAPRRSIGKLGRRALLISAGAGLATAGVVATGIVLDAIPDHDTDADATLSNGPPKLVRLSTGTHAPPLAALAVGQMNGIFTAYNLLIQLESHDRSDDAFADLAAGRLDAVISPAVRWLPALQGGLGASLVCGLHAGGTRLLVPRRSPIHRIEDVDGKRVAVARRDSSVVQMLAVMMRRKGMNPLQQIRWVETDPAHFVDALNAGEVDAIAGVDPLLWQLQHDLHLNQILSSDSGSFRQRVSSILGVSQAMLGARLDVVTALVHAIQDAAGWTARHPKEAGAMLAPQMGGMPADQVSAMLAAEGQDIHPIGAPLREQVAQYADDLKLLGVFADTLNSARFARMAVRDITPA